MTNENSPKTPSAEQQDAIKALDGIVLVDAGAGTGKTTVITHRLAALVNKEEVESDEILCVTFTSKASAEMLKRTKDLVGDSADGINLGTFHSVAFRILRENAELVDLTSNYTIIDAEKNAYFQKKEIIDKIIKEYNDQEEDKENKVVNYNDILDSIDRLKDEGIKAEGVVFEDVENTIKRYKSEASDKLINDVFKIYPKYQEKLKERNQVDYGDALLLNLQIFDKSPKILEYYQAKFKYILVDEFQDTNAVQYVWLKLLMAKHNNLCCVGDKNQSIYRWRGARIENILNFKKEFAHAKVFPLRENYRSTKRILDAASNLISHNSGQSGGRLVAKNEDLQGENNIPIKTGEQKDFEKPEQEVIHVVAEIQKIIKEGGDLDEVAILVKQNTFMKPFKFRLQKANIPFKEKEAERPGDTGDSNDANGKDKYGVSLMTMHAAKGLEFKYVFLPFWREGIIPDYRSQKEIEKMEEQRRLAYVAITRAKQYLTITCAKSKEWTHEDFKHFEDFINYGQSIFFDELKSPESKNPYILIR